MLRPGDAHALRDSLKPSLQLCATVDDKLAESARQLDKQSQTLMTNHRKRKGSRGGAEGRGSRGEGEQRGGGAEERASEMTNLVNLRPGFIEVVCVLDQQQHVILYLLQVSILTILLGGKEKIWKRKR